MRNHFIEGPCLEDGILELGILEPLTIPRPIYWSRGVLIDVHIVSCLGVQDWTPHA